MEALLQALKDGDEIEINRLAKELFTTWSGQLNMAQVNEFEKFANCRIIPLNGLHVFLGISYGEKTHVIG